MALIKSKDYKNIECNYWKIISANEDYKLGTTKVMLGLYQNKEARDENTNNFVMREPVTVTGVDLTRANMYSKITASNIVDEVETNWYADAVSDEVEEPVE